MPAEPPAGISSTTTVPPTWTSPRLPRMCGGSPPQTAFYGSLLVQACDFVSVPFRPQVTPGALNIDYRTSTAKAREGLPPPRQLNCQAYTHLEFTPFGRELPSRATAGGSLAIATSAKNHGPHRPDSTRAHPGK